MGEMKPTPGVWKWDSDPMKGDPLGRVRYRVVTTGKTITQCYYSSSDEHSESDARLIAEAGTVFHNTGLSPVQLVERVKELEGVLKRCADNLNGPTAWTLEQGDLLIEDVYAALAKCEGVGNDR